MSEALHPVETLDELIESVENFRAGAANNLDLVLDLLRRVSLWVYDPASGHFGPNKFVGFQHMTFPHYRRARLGESSGAKFDANVVHGPIESILDGKFQPNEHLSAQCLRWGQELCGPEAFPGINIGKWQFLTLPREPNVVQEREIANAAESIRAGVQGFRSSPEARRAIELRAMHVATAHFEMHGYTVADVSGRESYDLDCRKQDEVLRVEVKGTETPGSVIILTRNEVRVARAMYPATALAVVHDIVCELTPNGPKATGGTLHVVHPWRPDDADLSPISYECKLELPNERNK